MNTNFEEKIVDTQTTTEQEMVEPQQPTTTQETNVNETNVEEVKTIAKEPIAETIKTFTQDEVNEIVKKRLEKQASSQYKNYGVESAEELESLLAKGRDYQKLFEELEQLKTKNRDLVKESLFNKYKIDETRFDDVETYFKGKELDLTDENLAQALNNHNEWVKKIAEVEIGAEKQTNNDMNDLESERRRIFGDI